MTQATRAIGMAAAALGLALAAAGSARAGIIDDVKAQGPALNLVTNGGFETGDFTGWTLSGSTVNFAVNNFPRLIHSGTFGVAFSPQAAEGSLSQTIATTAGHNYQVSFWLQNVVHNSSPSDHFSASFGGQTPVSVSQPTDFAYTLFTFTVAATSATSNLTLTAQTPFNDFALDDVSVTDLGPATSVPEPSSLVVTALALMLAGLGRAAVWSAQRQSGPGSRWRSGPR